MDTRYYYEVDPDGDVMLVLGNQPGDESDASEDDSSEDEEPAEAVKASVSQALPLVQRELLTHPNVLAEFGQGANCMQLSSRHLALASVYFRKMFSGLWKDGHQLRANHQCQITEEGWALEPFLVLMYIIHGRTREVPREITLDMLAEIATLVDYYQCSEAVGIISEVWINQLGKELPSSFSRDVILWIWISIVFRQPDIFNSMTKVAQQQSRAPIQAQGLPIQQAIIGKCSSTTKLFISRLQLTRRADKIEEERQELIHRIVTFLHDLLADFLKGGRHTCSYGCNCTLVGALTLGMNKLHLLSPRPAKPFLRFSFTETVNNIRDMQSPQRVPANNTRYNPKCGAKSCKLKSHIQPFIEGLEKSIAGLELGDFVFCEKYV